MEYKSLFLFKIKTIIYLRETLCHRAFVFHFMLLATFDVISKQSTSFSLKQASLYSGDFSRPILSKY